MPEADVHTADLADEQRQVDMRRYQEAFDAGLSHEEASAWAFSGEDVGLLRRLVADRCPPRLLARILL